jgi:hypothetical protein
LTIASDCQTALISLQVAVNVSDVNDNDPVFSNELSPQVNLSESSSAGVRLPEVFTATDADEGSNARIRYSIAPDSFMVDPDTGTAPFHLSFLDIARIWKEGRQANLHP